MENGKERPILFNAPMVRAIMDGKKTQTRRLMTPQPFAQPEDLDDGTFGVYAGDELAGVIRCHYGRPGDRLWVRETWRTEELPDGQDGIRFAADQEFVPIANTREASDIWLVDNDNGRHGTKWRPSIFMRRWASRITLEVTNVRVERLQDISEEDAMAEGVPPFGEEYSCFSLEQPIPCGEGRPSFAAGSRPYAASYAVLWDEINADRAPWSANPWVWVVEFKRVEAANGKR
jgi:hypothetical protein